MADQFVPTFYTRHQRPLRAFLLEFQVWFHAQDLGRLMGRQLDEKQVRKLDPDQYRQIPLRCGPDTKDTLIISESGAYALLVYHYAPENRELRRWLSQEVIPTMHARPQAADHPALSLLRWPGLTLRMLIWQDEPWIRWRDAPDLMQTGERPPRQSLVQRLKRALNRSHWKA